MDIRMLQHHRLGINVANLSWENWWATLKGNRRLQEGIIKVRRQGIMAYAAWHIWKQRNTLLYQHDEVMDAERVVRKVLFEADERGGRVYGEKTSSGLKQNSVLVSWKPLVDG